MIHTTPKKPISNFQKTTENDGAITLITFYVNEYSVHGINGFIKYLVSTSLQMKDHKIINLMIAL